MGLPAAAHRLLAACPLCGVDHKDLPAGHEPSVFSLLIVRAIRLLTCITPAAELINDQGMQDVNIYMNQTKPE